MREPAQHGPEGSAFLLLSPREAIRKLRSVDALEDVPGSTARQEGVFEDVLQTSDQIHGVLCAFHQPASRAQRLKIMSTVIGPAHSGYIPARHIPAALPALSSPPPAVQSGPAAVGGVRPVTDPALSGSDVRHSLITADQSGSDSSV